MAAREERLISVQDQITVRSLRDRGMGVRCIARELRLSRNTVRRYLRDPAAPASPARPVRPNAQLEPFQHDIETMLAQELIGSRILAELRKQGYRGPQRTFYRYLARLATLQSPSPAVERFETEPARQGQYDWSEYTVLLGGAVTKVYVHSFVLGFSRFQHLSASLHVRQAAIFEALEDSFACVRGVPEEMLFDNPRALVTRPRPNLVFNPRVLEFARFYGFAPPGPAGPSALNPMARWRGRFSWSRSSSSKTVPFSTGPISTAAWLNLRPSS